MTGIKKIKLKAGEAVPFVITNTTLKRQPTVKRTSRFVGPGNGIKRLVYGIGIKIIDIMEEAFFVKETEIDDGEVQEQRHFAVFLANGEGGPYLDVEEISWKPASGHHYEIVKVAEQNLPSQDVEITRSREDTENTRLHLLKILAQDQQNHPLKSSPSSSNGTSNKIS